MKYLNFKNLFRRKTRVNLMVIAITIVFLFSFVSPAICGGAQAADTGLKATADASGLPTSGDLTTIIGQIIYTILGFLGVAFVILVLYGGAKRMFAKGDTKQIQDSTGIITSAVVGVAIILLSYIITAFVISQVKSNIGAGGGGDGSSLSDGNTAPSASLGDCTTSDTRTGKCQISSSVCTSGVTCYACTVQGGGTWSVNETCVTTPKAPGENCSNDDECMSGYCNPSNHQCEN